MKILQIIYSLSSGGAERFVVDLSNEMAKRGHELSLCVLRDDRKENNGFYKSELSNKINYINLCLPLGFHFSNILILYKLVTQLKPDIVHCHQNLVDYVFPFSILFRKISFFHTIHTYPPNEVKNKLEYWLKRIFYTSKKFKAITISKETSKSFINYYKTHRFTEIDNGRKEPTSSDEIQHVTNYFNNLRHENTTIFIHVARCDEVKNQKMLIKVFNRLLAEDRPIILLIIGDGYESALGEELKSMASDKIIFLGQRHNIADYYLNADAFCLSSTHEGMPITLIEALACGCTPICTPVGGILGAIEHGITGFLSKSISEEDYYQTIINYLIRKNEIEKEKLIENFKTHYSIEECSMNHILLYGQ